VRSLLPVLLAACFSPAPPTGVPCDTDRDCPAAQVCHSVTRTCELTCDGCDVDAGTDAPVDLTCWSRWLDGTVELDPPVKLTNLSIPNVNSQNPSVTADGLAIYFDRNQDYFRASRASLADDFANPVRIDELATNLNESRISTTADDQLGVFASARTGTLGLLDLWQAERGSDGTFGVPDSSLFEAVNDAENQFDPELGPDGLDLYWAPAEAGIQRIHHISRLSTSDPFKGPRTLTLDLAGYDQYFDPTIAPDQRVLAFAAKPDGGTPDLLYTTRPSPNAQFGVVQQIPGVNTSQAEGDPELAADGCTLYFASNREGQGSAVWSATIKR
jgi:hypothetical protein